MSTDSALRVAVVFPDLLGTYGDGGNGMVLARRAQWRGFDVELLQATSDKQLPTADIYCIGGGEDGPQVRAALALRSSDTLTRAIDHGAVVLAVCAGFQIVGATFPDSQGEVQLGVGLLDVETLRGTMERSVGEVLSQPRAIRGPNPSRQTTLPLMSGFENHAGVTSLGPRAQPLATVVQGEGNNDGSGFEGAWQGSVFGTYLHGPVLARNPAVADLLLGWAFGADTELALLDDATETALRAERIGSASGHRRFRRR